MFSSAIQYPDFLIFAALCFGAVAVLHALFWRGSGQNLLPILTWLSMSGVVAGAWFVTSAEGERERDRLRQTLEGFAPTYASGMETQGHARINKETDPEDPGYLRLIETQKRWLSVNPDAHDIYTFRRGKPGFVQYIVDSETDYDRNGVIDGDNEARTDIGEESEVSDQETVDALDGKAGFSLVPATDRWGTWVSAYAPIHNEQGELEAVLGVDFDASSLLAAVKRGRLAALTLMGVCAAGVAGLAIAASLAISRADGQRRHDLALQEEAERLKFETLVNSIDGVVYEWSGSASRFDFVSRQAAAIFGYPVENWLRDGFWQSALHPDDREAALADCYANVKRGQPYESEYRMIAADGRVVWIRETGNVQAGVTAASNVSRGVLQDISAQKAAAEELEMVNRQLVDTSRQAGMAEVASGVLHNVGNVLNSVNVSSLHIHERLRQSRVGNLKRLAGMILAEKGRLGEFFTTDERGRIVPGYLDQLSDAITEEHEDLRRELDSLLRNIEHIKDIVMVQQSCARVSGRTENFDIHTLIDDALRINDSAFTRHRIQLVRRFGSLPAISGDRHKTLQILVNLVRNAKQALDSSPRDNRVLTVTTEATEDGGLAVHIADNGVGIAPENVTRIFQHGFTTRKTGHGFGLHISALSANEMGGRLSLHSEGPGRGACFTLTLPATLPDRLETDLSALAA